MDRELIEYLPEFMREYREIKIICVKEQQQVEKIWEQCERIWDNQFIATADEYGISRFEKMLHIFPSKEDSLESRRERVQSRWLDAVPYTMRMLLKRLISLCGETDFQLTGNFEQGYTLILETSLKEFGKVAELEKIIASMLPCNITTSVHNETYADLKGTVWMFGTASVSESITIST